MTKINYDKIISQLKTEINSECAISNNYGIVLASSIKEFSKGRIIPHKILELITDRIKVASELNIAQINSFALGAQENNYLFTFSEELILISKLNLDVNLAKFMPNISVFLEKLSKGSKRVDLEEFSDFDFTKEIQKIESALQEEQGNKEKYSIIKDLIKFISK